MDGNDVIELASQGSLYFRMMVRVVVTVEPLYNGNVYDRQFLTINFFREVYGGKIVLKLSFGTASHVCYREVSSIVCY